MGIITFSRKAAAVLLVYVAGAGSASAAPVVGTVFDNWAIECELPPGGKEKKCFITQFVMANKEGDPQPVVR